MHSLPHTPAPQVSLLVTGHFIQGGEYFSYRPRGTSDWLAILTLKGLGRFGYEGGELIAEPGDFILLRPGTPHDYGVEPTLRHWELLWAHFHPHPHWLQWLAWPEVTEGLMQLRLSDPADRQRIQEAFALVHRLAIGHQRLHEARAMNALERVWLECDPLNPLSPQARLDGRIRQAMDYITRSLNQPLPLHDVAAAAGLSVSRLSHLFRAQLRTTPQQFIENQRLMRARQLLAFSSLSIHQIARQVGFENPFYFSLRFKRQTGQSPTQYRAEQIGAHPPESTEI